MSSGSSGGNTNVAYWANPETIVVCGNLAAPTL
jgi:hypothetical protein